MLTTLQPSPLCLTTRNALRWPARASGQVSFTGLPPGFNRVLERLLALSVLAQGGCCFSAHCSLASPLDE